MASRHARKFGRKEKSRTHLHRPLSNFWTSYSNAITLSSTENIISRSKALLWVPKWHLHTPTFSWVVPRDSCWSRWPWDHFIAKVHWRYWHEVVARSRDFDSFPRRSQQLPPEHKVYGWNFNQAARVSGHQIKSCGRYNICWSVYKTNRYTPVSHTHKLPPKILLQKCSLQPCTSAQTYLLRFGHLWIKSKRTDWPPLQTGLSETGNFTCHWESTATKERTCFLIGLNPSRTFSPSCWHITQTCQKWGI